MNNNTWCTKHLTNCFKGGSSSSTCRRQVIASNNSVEDRDIITSSQQILADGQQIESMADFYVPYTIIKHRVVRRVGTIPQLQFFIQWDNGWTVNKKLAKRVIKKYPNEELFYVQYKLNWEPSTNATIIPFISDYMNKNNITLFGEPFDQQIRNSIPDVQEANDIVPFYHFDYTEPKTTATENKSQSLIVKKKRGRPPSTQSKKENSPKERILYTTPVCTCKRKCFEVFHMSIRNKILLEFAKITDYSQKQAWVSNLVDMTAVPLGSNGLNIRTSGRSRKKYTAKYHFYKHKKRIRVCRRFFETTIKLFGTMNNLNNHNFSQTFAGQNQMTIRTDNRGRHKPKHAANEDTLNILKKHINSFPREESHYTLNKKFTLDPELNVKKMHLLYKEQELENGRRALGYAKYIQMFNKYDLKFGSYKTDTCKTCDEFKEQLRINPDNTNIKEKKTLHLLEADFAYSMQKSDRLSAGDGYESAWMDMCSVQQIPKISTSASFYKRKYKVYIEDVYLASSKCHHMHIWGMQDGLKGANDVISCLYKSLQVIPATKHFILWCDNTSSQMKNRTVLLFLLHISDPESPLFMFERVSLKFAPVGHTFMSPGPDQAFGLISKAVKKKQVIGNPHEYIEIVDKLKKCKCEWLERNKHYDWGKYLKQYYSTGSDFMKSTDGEPFLMKSKWFSFGFSEIILDRKRVMIQHRSNEIRSRVSLSDTDWNLYSVQLKDHDISNKTYDFFIAHTSRIKLENKLIKDLCKQKDWVPVKYRELDIYN